MSIYTERWIARPKWLALSIPERIAYLDEMEAGMREITEDGARLIGLALNEDRRLHNRRCCYVAVWDMPDEDPQGRRLDAVLEAAGWHRYFKRASDVLNTVQTGAALPTRIAAN